MRLFKAQHDFVVVVGPVIELAIAIIAKAELKIRSADKNCSQALQSYPHRSVQHDAGQIRVLNRRRHYAKQNIDGGAPV